MSMSQPAALSSLTGSSTGWGGGGVCLLMNPGEMNTNHLLGEHSTRRLEPRGPDFYGHPSGRPSIFFGRG